MYKIVGYYICEKLDIPNFLVGNCETHDVRL